MNSSPHVSQFHPYHRSFALFRSAFLIPFLIATSFSRCRQSSVSRSFRPTSFTTSEDITPFARLQILLIGTAVRHVCCRRRKFNGYLQDIAQHLQWRKHLEQYISMKSTQDHPTEVIPMLDRVACLKPDTSSCHPRQVSDQSRVAMAFSCSASACSMQSMSPYCC